MKLSLIILLVLGARIAGASTCPNLTGKYHCEKASEAKIIFGASDIELSYGNSLLEVYILGVGGSKALYEVNSWNPEINPSTGEISKDTMTYASCDGSSATLKAELRDSESGFAATQISKFTPTDRGLEVKVSLDQDEVADLVCVKK